MIDSLTNGVKNQEEYAIAKSITVLEDESNDLSVSLRKEIYKTNSQTYVLGITGSPGAGKSTLISSLVNHLDNQMKIGIISIDPSNKYSGGALLGDRIRMSNLFTKKNIFIRSMSNRGIFGGLNKSIFDVVQLFSFAKYDLVIVETIGVGQNEIDISEIADTVLVISAPESGDSIQIIKAGLMEIADIYVINKADLSGSDKMEFLLKDNIQTNTKNNWTPRIIKIQANSGKNVDGLLELTLEHKDFLTQNNQLFSRRKLLLQKNIRESVIKKVTNNYIDPKIQSKEFKDSIKNVTCGKISFDETVNNLVHEIEKDIKNEN
ncbi:MAG: methylmalonyl Co-A mutase-associated GTPase MeaB [Caldisericia bacterium]|nr:methylmalonyl Co-A mutase-associated GTPase MeaB [Caldisericia bacterium]